MATVQRALSVAGTSVGYQVPLSASSVVVVCSGVGVFVQPLLHVLAFWEKASTAIRFPLDFAFRSGSTTTCTTLWPATPRRLRERLVVRFAYMSTVATRRPLRSIAAFPPRSDATYHITTRGPRAVKLAPDQGVPLTTTLPPWAVRFFVIAQGPVCGV
jgi:hypothetical protein